MFLWGDWQLLLTGLFCIKKIFWNQSGGSEDRSLFQHFLYFCSANILAFGSNWRYNFQMFKYKHFKNIGDLFLLKWSSYLPNILERSGFSPRGAKSSVLYVIIGIQSPCYHSQSTHWWICQRSPVRTGRVYYNGGTPSSFRSIWRHISESPISCPLTMK